MTKEKNTNSAFFLKNLLKTNINKIVLLIFLVFFVYVNSLRNDFVSDDFAFIYLPNFGKISSFLYSYAPYFSPINFIRYLVSFGGAAPYLFRSVNIYFHLGTVILIYFLLRKLFNEKLGFLTAAIFAVHPILTESITWVAGAPYSQYGFLLMLCFFFYIYASKNNFSQKNYILAILTYILAVLSNEKAIVFPAIILLYEFCFGNLKANWKRILPFFLFSLIWTIYLFTQIGYRHSVIQTSIYTQPKLINPLYQIPIAITSYLNLIFWPIKLSFYHSEMTFTTIQYIIRLTVFLTYTGLTIFLFFKNKKIFFWLAFFPIILSPTLTPFGISWIVAERYVYLASLGIIVPIGMAFTKFSDKIDKKLFYAIFSVIILLLSVRTIIRNADWKNQDTLWLATAKTSPSSPQNHNNLGDLYGRRGDLNRAVKEFQTAIKLLPGYADAYHNLANTYVQLNRTDLGIENYQKAIYYNPNLWQSYLNLASIFFEQGNNEEAIKMAQNSININPQIPNSHLILGLSYLRLKNNEKAKIEILYTLKLDPQNQTAGKILKTIP